MAQIRYIAVVKEPGPLTFTYKGRTFHKGQPQEVGSKEAADLKGCPEMFVEEVRPPAPPPEPEPAPEEPAVEEPAAEEPAPEEAPAEEPVDLASIPVEDMTQEQYEQAVALGIVVPPEEAPAEEPAPEPEPAPVVTSKAAPKKQPAKAKGKVAK